MICYWIFYCLVVPVFLLFISSSWFLGSVNYATLPCNFLFCFIPLTFFGYLVLLQILSKLFNSSSVILGNGEITLRKLGVAISNSNYRFWLFEGLWQVGHLGETYQEWVHQPIVSKEGPRFFESDFWEVSTKILKYFN